MKASIVITADQIGSRRGSSPPAKVTLDLLEPLVHGAGSRKFAQQAGDEIQGLLTTSVDAVSALEVLTRVGKWRVGVGIGMVDTPVPRDVRVANGSAFVAARHALTAARGAPQDLRVEAADAPTGRATRVADGVRDLQTALWLTRIVWRRRTDTGWQAIDAVQQSRTQQDAALALGITPSALSQRLSAAAREEGQAGSRLAAVLMDALRDAVAANLGTAVGTDR
ncbi:hypothetical protein [Rudaeicoccus suwonensis]|uniref:SatD family protein n=1 Tax=Rudaeicoccus suwonensis TaxID=657409 RepID=A0A561EB17_9MICO|nr:hypothetical protein [Rudaeicoccus suwonensis]TWE12801.1 hypothetical protein BKA23_1619 [Rudaeicoccus suwonensis]